MLWVMIKNNLKLTSRSKFIIVLLIISPIIVMAALSSAFDELLQSNYQFEDIRIGYATEDQSALDRFLTQSADAFAEKEIKLEKCDLVNGKEMVSDGTMETFLYEEDAQVKIYTLKEDSIPTEMCQYIVEQFYTDCGNMGNTTSVGVEKGSLPSMVLPSAGNYYGIIEMIYFLSCGVLFLTAVVQSERKNRISQRFISSPCSSFTIYLSKFIPCAVMTILNTIMSMIAATLLFDVKWGNFPATVGVLVLGVMAFVAFGIMCLYLVNNLAVSVIIIFVVVWICGFLGGSFETYMFMKIPERTKCLSPMYYLNRTLVEYSTMGHSDYAVRCVGCLAVIFVVCSLFGSLLMKQRMEVE